jgi:hypothetical protein
MIRERSAGPQMISRLEHKSLLACVRGCVLVLSAKPAMYHDWLPHASNELLCMLRVWCLYCICMYLNHFMHVHAHIEGLHVYARTPSLACLRMRLLISRAEQFSASVCFYRGMSVSALIGCMRLSACGSRAEHLLACL